MAISARLKEIYGGNLSGAFYVEALSFYHPSVPAGLHLTSYMAGFKGRTTGSDEDFIYTPLTVVLPTKDTSGTQSITITLANDEQNIVDDLELMVRKPFDPILCFYRVYLTTEKYPSGSLREQLDPAWSYEVSSAAVTDKTVIMQATKENLHNRAWPRKVYRSDMFPGLQK